MSSESTIQKAQQAVTAGELWRAKEILQGRIGAQGFDVAVYEAYGDLLRGMGDTLEAGKYLFLSGVRTPHYKEAIELFLTRHARTDIRQLHRSFPNGMRATAWEILPVVVRDELAARGYSEKEIKKALGQVYKSTFTDGIMIYGCLSAILIVAALFLIGAWSGLRTVIGWF